MKQLWELLSSRRVALFLFFLVLGLSLIGAIIPQGRPWAYYDATYVGAAAKILWVLRFTDVYHTWYFALTLVLLGASLVTCSVRRFKQVWRAVTRKKPEGVNVWPARTVVGAVPDDNALRAALGRIPGFRWQRIDEGWYGRRHGFAAAGEFVTHAGVFLILLAASLRAFGHRETVYIFEGNEVMLPSYVGDGYSLAAEKVEEIKDPNTGAVREYRSRLRLARNGKTILVRDVEVNEPLTYGGFGLYQSEMDVAGARGLAVSATRLKKGVIPEEYGRADFTWVLGSKTGTVNLIPGQSAPLGDTGYTLLYGDYFEYFSTGEGGITDGNPQYNPAAIIAVRNPQGDVGMGIVFKLRPEYSMMRKSDPTSVSYTHLTLPTIYSV